MSAMVVAVGSMREPKVEAVRRALARLRPVAADLARATVIARDVADVSPVMPLDLAALLSGARARAERALDLTRAEGRPADLAVGLEGGIDVRSEAQGRRGFLMSWAFVTDGRRGAHGCGGAIEVPESLLGRVVEGGVELATVVDAAAGQHDVRSRQGAWGVLTRGLVERAFSFEVALLNALAPFYNPEAYS
jgi:non-canonical (house-cleaning) NTP pyrophosphatase